MGEWKPRGAEPSIIYLVINKREAARIINTKVNKLKITHESEDSIAFGYDDVWRVGLEDYKFKNTKVETPAGGVETGVLGTKMSYKHWNGPAKEAKNAVEEYIETG